MTKLGFGPVKRSTLADANSVRPVAILEDLFHHLLGEANKVAPRKNGFRFKGDVFALDSSTIELCLELCPWAKFHHGKGACKLHTAIDVAANLPQFSIITEGRRHDLTAIKNQIFFPPKSTVVFDRAYVDYEWMNSINQAGAFFVTRCKSNCKFKVYESRKTNRTRGHICDQLIYLKSAKGKLYKGKLRRITYRDPDTGKRLTFLTNRMDLATQTICDLYKSRWKVELFFKTLKQNLKVKKFLGTSSNAVKAQIMVALIAYLLIQILRYSLKSSISIPDAMAVIGTLLLLREPLKRLLGDLPAVTRHPPPFQLTLF
jgi:putative transposase